MMRVEVEVEVESQFRPPAQRATMSSSAPCWRYAATFRPCGLAEHQSRGDNG
jgi:hypothetical protein